MTDPGSPLLEARAISKSFAQTRALVGANLTLRPGVTHALLGANGAGKSTLSRVISGHVRRDGGEILYRGEPRDVRSPREALDAGIAMVMQETSLAPDLSVLENIFLPDLGRPGRLSRPTMRRRASEILADLGQEHAVSLDTEARDLSAAQRQLVEIAKALALKANLIIFDEPTASLSPSEVERLFDVIARLEAAQCSIVFVSHRLEEVFAISDEITVMREGRTVAASRPTSSLNQTELVRLMVGRDLGSIYAPSSVAIDKRGEPVLSVRALRAPPMVRDISFDLHRGEILGLGGLVGAGRSETVETLFGLRPRAGGEVLYDGRPFAPRAPSEAIRAGIGFVAEDRRRQSIVPDLSVRENSASRPSRRASRVRPRLWQAGKENRRTDGASRVTPRPTVRAEPLELLRRHAAEDHHRAMAAAGTQGLDPGRADQGRGHWHARLDLRDPARHRRDRRGNPHRFLRIRGTAGLADRVIVVSDGASIADVPSAYLDEEKLTLLAAPRASMERYRRLLQELANQCDGAAFWAILDDERIFCLNTATANPKADPSLSAGAAPRFEETPISTALKARSTDFVLDPKSGLKSLVVDVRSHRGHELGSIGVVIRPDSPAPPAEAMRSQIQERFRATL